LANVKHKYFRTSERLLNYHTEHGKDQLRWCTISPCDETMIKNVCHFMDKRYHRYSVDSRLAASEGKIRGFQMKICSARINRICSLPQQLWILTIATVPGSSIFKSLANNRRLTILLNPIVSKDNIYNNNNNNNKKKKKRKR